MTDARSPLHYLDHDFPEVFTIWSWDRRARRWAYERTALRRELARDQDGAYGHQTVGSPLLLRIVSKRGGVLTIHDGAGRPWRCLVLPDVGDSYVSPWG